MNLSKTLSTSDSEPRRMNVGSWCASTPISWVCQSLWPALVLSEKKHGLFRSLQGALLLPRTCLTMWMPGTRRKGPIIKSEVFLCIYHVHRSISLTFAEMFRLFADNNQCKHIFFAGCHDTGYLSLLTPYRGKAERITLIKAASFHHDFSSLEFAIRELPSVFMSTQVGGGHVPPSPTVPLGAKICTHYQKVLCPPPHSGAL